ncbi:hypothetical protein FJTKL_15415 [Diaporthe vaccinii]|uniref:Aminoglycoside phosphotransferase domain-containing protein n=1 Tax=Diaporthe vaccinii TaxID=105482 RepID=A0ABR4E4Z5_9PEZI
MSNPDEMRIEGLRLPRIPGPKLEPFRGTATADIEFIEFIGNGEDMDSKVWKVRIDGKVFALKVFAFQSWERLKTIHGHWVVPQSFDPFGPPDPTPQDWIDYLDPFNCECRVYGRLKEEHREELAVRAHGYVLLTRDQEKHITDVLDEYVDWEDHPEPLNRSGLFKRMEAHRREPLRAIVKDYVESSVPWTAPQVPQMYADLEELHKLGILVRVFNQGNYLGGKLVDFSMAWTMYHICIDRALPVSVSVMRSWEPSRFDTMVDEWASRYGEKIEKPEELLRHRSSNLLWEADFGFDPRLYDWGKRVEVRDEECGLVPTTANKPDC